MSSSLVGDAGDTGDTDDFKRFKIYEKVCIHYKYLNHCKGVFDIKPLLFSFLFIGDTGDNKKKLLPFIRIHCLLVTLVTLKILNFTKKII